MNEWCTDCKEYDTEKHCCPRFNKVIRHTMNDRINEVLDKIRTEIKQTAIDYDKFEDIRRVRGLWKALQIIDKYKISEGRE